MLRVLGMQVIGLLVWSFDAWHLFSPSGCSQLIGYGRVLGEVCAWTWDLILFSEDKRRPNSEVREPQKLGVQGQMLGPARAPPFGQCPVMGPNSVVREPQELGVQGQMLGPARAPPFGQYPVMGPDSVMLGPARAPPFGQCSIMRPNSVVREPHELGVQGQMLGPARAPSFGQCPVMGPDSCGSWTTELGPMTGH
ncbi:hypothetical protein TIFTF001_024833 [Ficus carica]|uniref:Uncharacterized protein n=1 Tax=Ficus carica TaxID=3494 RepID=A0AA88AW62_FICCA|nr:hypothetical protein TIFTF001_024833 [Ficus carica]